MQKTALIVRVEKKKQMEEEKARVEELKQSMSIIEQLLDNIQSLSSSAYRGFDPEREAVLQVAAAAPTICGALFFVFVSLVRL